MGEVVGDVAGHYKLPNPYPTTWPAELDEDEDEIDSKAPGSVRRSKSRYSALERNASDRRSVLPGSQRTGDGRANLVQKDEPDPLGASSSVVQSLRQRGLPIEQDERLRNKFLLSSTTFSPALFLSQSHSNATTDDLLRGLEFLSKSIDQKSASLKVLVESNFERFVRAKATIDNVYTEMRNQGIEPETHLSPRHSRQVSRSSGHYRNFSSGSAAGMAAAPVVQNYSKNALRKESEYGVQGIKGPLLDVSQKAEEVWGPALGGREREASLKSVAEAIERDKPLYELGANLAQSIKQKDYEAIVQQYSAARLYANEARAMSERASHGPPLTDEQVQKILVTGRMWMDVDDQVAALKRAIWRRLSSMQPALPLPGASQTEEHMELIAVLLELGVDENPIWVWLLSRYDYLKTKIGAVADRSKVEIEILRRRLAAGERPSPQQTASYLRQAAKEHPEALDSDQVLEFWQTILTYVTKLLSLSSGLLGEVVDFWGATQAFIEGHKQHALPGGYEGQSRKHHRLSEAGVKQLQKGVVALVDMIRGAVFSLFADPPIDDISALFSPASASTPKTPTSAAFSPTDGRLGKIDSSSLPGPSPKIGEPWEDFGFWPPYSNSLSAVHYLGKVLNLAGTAAGEMAGLGPVANDVQAHERIKAMVGGARERCMRAVCDAWSKDAESCKHLEDWTRAPDKPDQTRMPLHFIAFEKAVLVGVQQVLYLSEAITKPGSREIVTPPPSKLLQMARSQFVSSLYKALSGMLENAETSLKTDEDDWVLVTNSMATANLDNNSLAPDAINASSRNVRMLLTLSNLKALRTDHVPQLITLFESSFSVKLTEESKAIRDVFGQLDAKLFHAYTQPTVASLIKTIREGIHSPDWVPKTNRPNQVKPYVYATMMILVMVHTEVTTTVSNPGNASSALLTETLSYLLENVSQALLDAFKDRKPNVYSLPALMQATLDTEFIDQTMAKYATSKANDIQTQIYLELDKRSNNESKAGLQKELTELRVVLKTLREASRGSFGCFKRQRPGGGDRGRSERKVTA